MDRDQSTAPASLLASIGRQETEPICMAFNTASEPMHAAHMYGIAAGRMTVYLFGHYRDWCKERSCQLDSQVVAVQDGVLRELLLNAAEHGNRWKSDRKIYVTVWIGAEGFIVACRDEGDFFKQKEVKERIESRQRIHADKRDRGNGTRFIYGCMDEIKVDTKTGTIFLALYYKRSATWKNQDA